MSIVCDLEGYMFTTHEPQIMKMKWTVVQSNHKMLQLCLSRKWRRGCKGRTWIELGISRFFRNQLSYHTLTKSYDILSDDMLLIDFMSEIYQKER